MSASRNGGPAFPGTPEGWDENGRVTAYEGMSLRDYFAAHAPFEYLAVMAQKVQEAGDKDTDVATIMSAAAFMYADAMLAEREKP